MRRDVDDAIAGLAQAQSNAFSRRQMLDCGGDDHLIRRRLAAGRWRMVHPGVYVLVGAPASWLTAVWAAALAAGPDAVVSHAAAAALYGFTGFPRRAVVLTVPHGSHHRVSGATVHQFRDHPTAHAQRHNPSGLVLTTPARTVVDLAAELGRARLAVVAEEAVLERHTTWLDLGQCLSDVARRGKQGVVRMALVLDEQRPGRPVPASQLERELHSLIERFDLPPLVRQVAHPGRHGVSGCVDGAYVDARLIVEADGRRWHTRIADLKRDHERDAQAARVGWQTLRFLGEHIKADPEGVAATIADVRAVRLALVA